MKQIKITTSKGEFLVVDSTTLDKVSGQALVDDYGDYIMISDITEEEASEIVEDINDKKFIRYSDYTRRCNSAIESLHSLLKSKGIHLKHNPFKTESFKGATEAQIQRAEEKTFYNPYIFKL